MFGIRTGTEIILKSFVIHKQKRKHSQTGKLRGSFGFMKDFAQVKGRRVASVRSEREMVGEKLACIAEKKDVHSKGLTFAKQKEYNKYMIVKSEVSTNVYKYIIKYTIKYGKFPTLDEIAARFEFTRERARQQLEKLCKLGYLEKQGRALHRSYAFRIVDLPAVNRTVLKKIENANILKTIKVANRKIKNHAKNAKQRNTKKGTHA